MYRKIKTCFHAVAVIAIFFFTDSFCQEVIGRVFRICNSIIVIEILYICIDILNVWLAVFLYSKYILKMSFSKMYLGKPLPALHWCATAFMIPLTTAFLHMIIKGELTAGYPARSELPYIMFHNIFSSGLRAAVTEGMIFRGVLFRVIENEYGKRYLTIFISGFLYAAAKSIMSFAWIGTDGFCMFISMFLMGVALAFVTCETGSIWSSVIVHALCTVFSGNESMLYIIDYLIIIAVVTLKYKRRHDDEKREA